MLKNLVRVTVLVVITAAAATSWVDGPSRTAEQVVRLASEGQFEELSELIVAPCALESTEDGGVRVVDAEGTEARIPAERLPFRAGAHTPVDRGTRTFRDIIEGRYGFTIAAVGFGKDEPREGQPVTVLLSVERGDVTVDQIVH